MTFFLLLLTLVLTGIVASFWVYRRGETVDLQNPEARSKAAAHWLSQGEGTEAEHMLRTAVEVLQDWDQVLARRDLANLLAASGQVEQAIVELSPIFSQKWAGHEPDVAEMQIDSAEMQASLGGRTEAIAELLAAENSEADPLAVALLQEARGLLLVQSDKCVLAQPILRAAFATLSEIAHDRAASTWVTLAWALFATEKDLPWAEFDCLESELQLGVITNLSDRVDAFAGCTGSLLATVIAELSSRGKWREECHMLKQIVG